MSRIFQPLFWSAALVSLVMALLPRVPSLPGDPSDKLQHMAAFFTLAVLARLAWPRQSALWLFAALALFGAMIEIAQLIPGLNRDGDLLDWVADLVAAAIGLWAASLVGRVLARG